MDYAIKGETLESIANAIRQKTGKTEKMLPTKFADEITAISGGGGEKPTLFAPSIELNSVSSILTITDSNGGFVDGYNLYANDEFITVLTSKTATLTDYIEQTETLNIKVQAKNVSFNSSEFSNIVEWEYINVGGTAGLTYEIDKYNPLAHCIGIGDAVDTDIEIASSYEGYPVKIIGSKAFEGTSITSVKIPATVITIYGYAFRSCASLISVEIPNSVTSINSEAFYKCTALPSITLPSGLTTLTDGVIGYCTSLTYVNIPNSVTQIYGSPFTGCNKLTRIDFSNHTSVPAASSSNIFIFCPSNLQFKVPASLIDEWKAATNWSNYADKIVTEFTN